jgi:hypothetical protein
LGDSALDDSTFADSAFAVSAFADSAFADSAFANCILKGTVARDFTVIFWLEWIYIGLKGNRLWLLNFKDVSLILDSNFKY